VAERKAWTFFYGSYMPSAVASILALSVLAAAAACRFPQALSAEIVTQDRAVGVPCRVGVWQGDIGPLDGRGTPLLTASVRSGTAFQVDLTPALERAEAPLLWVSFECEGYHVRVRGFESGPFDTLLRPEIEFGRVWVPKGRPRSGGGQESAP
jgi:hypothetical protein